MRIALSWPHKLLWPNGSRGNHFSVSGAKKAAKNEASWLAIQYRNANGLPDFGEGEVKVTLYVHAKPKGPLPDKDNCVAAVKVQLDSIAKEIGVNDRRFAAPVVVFCEPRDGRIIIELSTPPSEGLHWPESADSAIEIGPSGVGAPPSRDPISSLERTE